MVVSSKFFRYLSKTHGNIYLRTIFYYNFWFWIPFGNKLVFLQQSLVYGTYIELGAWHWLWICLKLCLLLYLEIKFALISNVEVRIRKKGSRNRCRRDRCPPEEDLLICRHVVCTGGGSPQRRLDSFKNVQIINFYAKFFNILIILMKIFIFQKILKIFLEFFSRKFGQKFRKIQKFALKLDWIYQFR